MLLVPMTLTATLGTMSFSRPDGTAIVSFWPAAAFQVVFSIWFGVYGALAGIIGPMLGNTLVGGSPFLYIPANLIQCCLAGLWFRHLKLDPRLRSKRDWIGLIVVGCIAGNALGALAGVTESYLRNVAAAGASYDWWGTLLRWFSGNTVPCVLLAAALMKVASPMVVRDPVFCQSFWGGAGGAHECKCRVRFRDLPMVGKLMVLLLVAGIVPLLAVAGSSVWDTMKGADRLAAEINRQVAHDIRNEIERHELMLRLWATELAHPGVEEDDREALLAQWSEVPQGFELLEIIELERVLEEMPAGQREIFREQSVAFYDAVTESGEPALRGAFRLASMRGKALTGLVVWRERSPFATRVAEGQALLVLDRDGHELYRNLPEELDGWRPAKRSSESRAVPTVRHEGHTWHMVETDLPRLGWRFVALTSARAGQALFLANIPSHLSVLINLAIFGSLIGGSAIAQRISGRVLTMARVVRETGGEPGKLRLPVSGRDELGYLAETLNRTSDELAASVRELRETTAEKERLAAEMELAHEMQTSILPTEPLDVPGYELAAACHPAREVGGDFYDYFVGGPEHAVMMIGDAVGKGLKAAMLTTETHALAHAAARHLATPGKILDAVNSSMLSTRRELSGDFVTMVCAMLQPHRNRLLYASAGHPSPILVRDGQIQALELGGYPLAIDPEADYPLRRIEIAPCDTVILYTDGVTDAADTGGDRFGLEHLHELARRHAGLGAAQMLDAVLETLRAFASGAPQADDITLLVLRRSE